MQMDHGGPGGRAIGGGLSMVGVGEAKVKRAEIKATVDICLLWGLKGQVQC